MWIFVYSNNVSTVKFTNKSGQISYALACIYRRWWRCHQGRKISRLLGAVILTYRTSYGTHANEIVHGRIPNILTTYPTFFGFKTKNNLSLQGSWYTGHITQSNLYGPEVAMVLCPLWTSVRKNRNILRNRRTKKTNFCLLSLSRGESFLFFYYLACLVYVDMVKFNKRRSLFKQQSP